MAPPPGDEGAPTAGTQAAGREGQVVVFVTGPSGAGRSTAIRALEDLGFEVIDNLPLSLVPRLLQGTDTPGRPLAIGIDARTRGFSPTALAETAIALRDVPNLTGTLLYLDCADAVLLRRFSETRRRHPLAPDGSAETGLARELALLHPLREMADILIDTTDLTPHDLKAELQRWFGGAGMQGLALSVVSFSYKRGIPGGLDILFDMRFLSNPHWIPELRPMDGRDPAVAAHVKSDPLFETFFSRFTGLISDLLPAYRDEGKAYLSVGFGCTGGQHRSVCVAEAAAKRLELAGWPVSIRHRELERLGRSANARKGK
ncbi:RNase adapter RapZ [Paroceanicella profunda]|uniref:RNase adapter RapZ n=1 Tax=Paroceanicella profunda TaxID=2579971 RepID=A0A5B8FX70_9RHOB|nr:RNase adapter RapZ [Paroceanicella profunda]QDL92184.1 RNase adapter RapZ [Paroceanicella profunda]